MTQVVCGVDGRHTTRAQFAIELVPVGKSIGDSLAHQFHILSFGWTAILETLIFFWGSVPALVCKTRAVSQ
jgi:hypothetical protein